MSKAGWLVIVIYIWPTLAVACPFLNVVKHCKTEHQVSIHVTPVVPSDPNHQPREEQNGGKPRVEVRVPIRGVQQQPGAIEGWGSWVEGGPVAGFRFRF